MLSVLHSNDTSRVVFKITASAWYVPRMLNHSEIKKKKKGALGPWKASRRIILSRHYYFMYASKLLQTWYWLFMIDYFVVIITAWNISQRGHHQSPCLILVRLSCLSSHIFPLNSPKLNKTSWNHGCIISSPSSYMHAAVVMADPNHPYLFEKIKNKIIIIIMVTGCCIRDTLRA